tara:strand:+ start:586 stop:855 length:270 start_codon:yes stop_codon:yes gene_type:complete
MNESKSKIDFEVDFEEFKTSKRNNFKERVWFIKYWANFINSNSDEKWSKGQAVLIDSQIQNSRNFYRNLLKTEKGKKKFNSLIKNLVRK